MPKMQADPSRPRDVLQKTSESVVGVFVARKNFARIKYCLKRAWHPNCRLHSFASMNC
jgi:hypothetical protein